MAPIRYTHHYHMRIGERAISKLSGIMDNAMDRE